MRDAKELAMRILTASIVIGPLMLIGALPVAVGQPVSSNTQTQSAAGSNSPGDRDTYTQKARSDMQEWQQKLDDFGAKAKAKGQQAGNAAENDLNTAWAKAQAGEQKLQNSGAEGWQEAKTAYEKASHELADTWNKIRPEDK
jgi:hypothetical protein